MSAPLTLARLEWYRRDLHAESAFAQVLDQLIETRKVLVEEARADAALTAEVLKPNGTATEWERLRAGYRPARDARMALAQRWAKEEEQG